MTEPVSRTRRDNLKRLAPLAFVALVLIAGPLVLLLSGGGGKEKLPGGVKRASSATYAGATTTPRRPAPPIDLPNYLGQHVTLSQYRGKVVLVTFLYTHCPDVCPLIAGNLRTAQAELGKQAGNVQMIAISVDPHGDTRKTVATFLHDHAMTGRMQYLIGTASQLASAWSDWNVGSQRDTVDPEAVAHSALVYGISASGKLTTLYPANFRPADIVHDVPLLEHS
jgi:protein SCO1